MHINILLKFLSVHLQVGHKGNTSWSNTNTGYRGNQ